MRMLVLAHETFGLGKSPIYHILLHTYNKSLHLLLWNYAKFYQKYPSTILTATMFCVISSTHHLLPSYDLPCYFLFFIARMVVANDPSAELMFLFITLHRYTTGPQHSHHLLSVFTYFLCQLSAFINLYSVLQSLQ